MDREIATRGTSVLVTLALVQGCTNDLPGDHLVSEGLRGETPRTIAPRGYYQNVYRGLEKTLQIGLHEHITPCADTSGSLRAF